ncbi:hypothetical protein ACTFIV_004816 [Dictyostelium citrinum]
MNHLNKLSKSNGLLYNALNYNRLLLSPSNLVKTNIRQILYTNNSNNNNNNDTNKYSINLYTTLFNNNYQKQLIREFRNGRRIKQSFFAQSTGEIFNQDILPGFLTILSSPLKWIDYGKSIYRNISSNALIKSKLKKLDKSDYSKKKFLVEAEEMFNELGKAVAEGNKNDINDLSTIQFSSVVFKNTGINDTNIKSYKTEWSGKIDSKKLIWSRAGQVKISQKETNFFAQNCVEFTGTQSIIVKDKNNDKVISSIENQPFKSQYIFERNISALPSQWRIASSTEFPIK